MKRAGKLAALALTGFLATGSPYAADTEAPEAAGDLSKAINGGRFKALLRYSGQYRDSNLHLLQDSSIPDISDEKVQQYSAIGGFVGYETRPWRHLSVGATVYASFPAGNNPDDRRGLGGLYEADGSQEPYLALGEAFVRYQRPGHLLKAGRQEMPDYRMVSLSDIRMSPITHSGAVYEYTAHRSVQFNVGYIARMKERNDWRFIDMARGARLQSSNRGKQLIRGDYNPDHYDEAGYTGPSKEMVMTAVLYGGDRITLEAWNYHVGDFVNSVYLHGRYRLRPVGSRLSWDIAAQYTRQWDVGSHIAGNIDTYHWGLRLGASSGALSGFAAYNKVDYNENSYDGGTLFVRWGTPQMFMSFQVQDAELAGAESLGAGLQYDFGARGILPGVVMRWRYGLYDLPDALTLTDARQDRREATFDLRYSFSRGSGFGIFTQMKGLSLQFRLALNNYRTDYDFEAYREIHGYDFESVTRDFYDARLYLDYRF
jgi:hypothetical protein